MSTDKPGDALLNLHVARAAVRTALRTIPAAEENKLRAIGQDLTCFLNHLVENYPELAQLADDTAESFTTDGKLKSGDER